MLPRRAEQQRCCRSRPASVRTLHLHSGRSGNTKHSPAASIEPARQQSRAHAPRFGRPARPHAGYRAPFGRCCADGPPLLRRAYLGALPDNLLSAANNSRGGLFQWTEGPTPRVRSIAAARQCFRLNLGSCTAARSDNGVLREHSAQHMRSLKSCQIWTHVILIKKRGGGLHRCIFMCPA